MFGEHESESPRVPSPWDPFLPSPPSAASSLGSTRCSGIPKLVPEVEEGNVEYKLKLTNISPARFDRLVTQLKWRLLEGGGQAYYELGVADSGALIGLTRNDLEQSLETLEMMAGEIGASVIVVKEIEVPRVMVALADKLSGYLDPETGEWANKMVSRRTRAVLPGEEERFAGTAHVITDDDTEPSTAEDTDFDDEDTVTDFSTPEDSSRGSPHPALALRSSNPTNPFRPSAQSSPFISALDDDLALFSMEPEPALEEDEFQLDPEPTIVTDTSGISVDLEINSVYKPRPLRRRAPVVTGLPVPGQGKRGQKLKAKKLHPWHTAPRDVSASGDTIVASRPVRASPEAKETKAQLRRIARDKRREEKHRAFLAALPNTTVAGGSAGSSASDDTNELVSGLEHMHVSVQAAPTATLAPTPPAQPKVDGVDENLAALARAADKLVQLGSSVDALLADEAPVTARVEPRLIVEALVVRKLSLEEAYLDFSGF